MTQITTRPLDSRRSRMPLRLMAAMLSFSAAALPAFSAGLQVSPTMVKVPAERGAEGLMLSNSRDATLHAQIRVFRWTQREGEDVLLQTEDIAVSPPMLEIPGGGSQLVRIVRIVPPPTDGREASYRVLVDELPVDVEPSEGAGLRLVLQYSIPVFLAPPADVVAAHQLQARVVRDGEAMTLELANPGNAHAQIADLVFVDADGERTSIAPGLSGYVLPGHWRRWPIAGIGISTGGRFMARVNGEPDERTLDIDATQH